MNKPHTIRVLLVDNHPVVLDGLRAILQTYAHLNVVGIAADAQAGLDLAAGLHPDVILLDINMPRISGIDAIGLFKNALPACGIIMLSMHHDKEYISSSVLRGASGYILKDVSTDEIAAAIEAAAKGGTYFSSGVADAILEAARIDESELLTTRERDVLRELVAGKNNREIADALGITIATAETHRKHLKKKLALKSTAELVRYALDRGIGVLAP
ncbi:MULTISPECIES: response regulator transcription factor [Rhizobium/Agrobacterium group]|uniref:response regulator transcription factor n=1 Tax=Rhizobium/Agrobacterium group TaxID=227290 RepID=UPI002300631B|nr:MULTISPECIES: response regulator transcription factor [Rhizobium/Agrobacterium group]MDA5634727.1 response regulator transcription factor [Agrobacterium sp. ST15.16.024]MDF1891703.1 response regulator transcription factor [Rhizobium rhizogenes]